MPSTPMHLVRSDSHRLLVIRERAAAHERELDVGLTYLTIQDVAQRWKVSRATVRAIPADELPYIPFGNGSQLKRRRYHPADVMRYEIEHGKIV
jgi:hypothetical protein